MSWRRLAVAGLLALAASRAAAGPYDPTFQFRTLRTAHFEIHFHGGEEQAATRLAAIAERVYDRLTLELRHVPAGRTHVVLVHQSDQPNGFAGVVPWNAIEIDAVPPTGADELGNTNDWLTYVFTHEFSHVLHLDRSRGWARVARAVLGRTEIAFPNLTLPEWQIEGFATLVESQDGDGRLHAEDFRMVVDEAARARHLEPIDRLNGGLVDWPSSTGWYAYGGRFHEYLAQHYGAERLVTLAERTSGRLPYLTSGAFKAVYGKSLAQLWREFETAEADLSDHGPAEERCGTCTEVTTRGFLVRTPRVDADGSLWFTASDPHGFPGLYRQSPGGPATRLAQRYGGTGLTLGHDFVVFDQLEVTRGAGLTSDLYALARRSGKVRRLTRDARLVDPDLSPDARLLAAIRTKPGGREIVVLDAQRLLESRDPAKADALPILSREGGDFDVFAAPRWSPDGRRLAVERRRLHGPSEIAILKPDLLPAGPALSSPRGRNVTPEWTADGDRLLFASDRDGGLFELFEATVATAAPSTRKIASPRGGAVSPAHAPDGDILFVGYTTKGFDLFRMPSPDVLAGDPRDSRPEGLRYTFTQTAPTPAGSPSEPGATADLGTPALPYRPWSTLAPRGWLPVIEQRDDRWRLGAAVVGSDVLGRHVIAGSATWAITDGPAASALVPGGRPDFAASYAYNRRQTVPFAGVSDQASLFDVADDRGHLVPVAEREQQITAGLYRSFRRVRWAQSLLGEARVDRITTDVPGATASVDRTAIGAAWTVNTARRYGYSISAEGGILAGLTTEAFSENGASNRDAHAVTADVRAYLPLGVPHAVLALRAAGGSSTGAAGVRRVFRLGGSNGEPLPGTFGDDTMSLLRGFDTGEFGGTRLALANVEARVPLAWPQRGWGTWPLFLRSVHATAFIDVGNAWRDRVRLRDTKTGLGGELSADVVAFFGLPLTWTAGVAWGHDGAGGVPNQRTIYFRVGPSF